MTPPIDYTSATWLQIAEWAAARIEALRALNDGDHDPAKTATLRGQIKALKELRGLPEAAARAANTPPGTPPGY